MRARAVRGGSPRVPRPAGSSSSSCMGARLPCPRRALRPPSGRRWTRETPGAAGRPARPTEGAGRSPPASGLGDRTVAPTPTGFVQSSPEAAGRGAAQPQQALPALKSRPTSVPGLAGITFCTQIGACAWPQSWAESSSGEGERSDQVGACHGGPEKDGVPDLSERTTWLRPHVGPWGGVGHIAEFPGRRSGLGSASLTF